MTDTPHNTDAILDDVGDFAPGAPKAPESPRIKKWNRRILQIGCLPVMIAGFLAALNIPNIVLVGTALALLIGVPIAAHTWWMRRANQAAYAAAMAEAETTGKRVRTVVTDSGDHEYRLEEREIFEPVEWPDPDA